MEEKEKEDNKKLTDKTDHREFSYEDLILHSLIKKNKLVFKK